MATNIYWPIFKSIEHETINLSYNIHMDDNQLNVYSAKIMDLILRAAAEIESISKELYKLNGGTKTGEIKYDNDALVHLNNIWLIDKKEVIISHPNCFQTTKVILPFVKNETRTGKTYLTYSWNNAYQNLKHDRANSLHFGSVKYLFDILAALYILNIYYKNEKINLGLDNTGVSFHTNAGSDLFAIILSKEKDGLLDGTYRKNIDFDKAVYFVKMTDDAIQEEEKGREGVNQQYSDFLLAEPKIKKYLEDNGKTIDDLDMKLASDILGEEENSKILKRCTKIFEFGQLLSKFQYEAVLNKNQV